MGSNLDVYVWFHILRSIFRRFFCVHSKKLSPVIHVFKISTFCLNETNADLISRRSTIANFFGLFFDSQMNFHGFIEEVCQDGFCVLGRRANCSMTFQQFVRFAQMILSLLLDTKKILQRKIFLC